MRAAVSVTEASFFLEQDVRPRHCDAQGIVHASRYQDFCEDAFVGWLEFVGVPYSSLRAAGVDLVISESRYRYRRPARLDDRLRVVVSGNVISESSLAARFEVRRGPDLLATADVTYVAVHDDRRCNLPGLFQRLAPVAPSTTAESLLAALHNAQTRLYGEGDVTGVVELLDPRIAWWVPGQNRIAGTYRGIDQVVAYMRRRRALTNDTFRMHRREVLVGPSHFAALTDGTAERHGRTHSWSTIGLYRARHRRITECSLIPVDATAFDAAWQ